MLLLIPASLMANSHKIAELLLGLFGLGGAVLLLVAGIWLRFRWVNVTALVLSGGAAFLFRLLSHAGKLNTPASILCVTSITVALVAFWRATSSSAAPSQAALPDDPADDGGNRLRLRRRKRRSDS